MKNKPALIVLVVAALVVLLGVFYFVSSKSGTLPSSSLNNSSSEENSILGLLSSGKTQECKFSSTDENGAKTNGKVYISGENIRTNISTDKDSKSQNIYMIRRGNENFVWGSAFPNNSGIKMNMSLDEIAGNEKTSEYINPTDKMNFSCSDWDEDSSLFEEPNDVDFMDFSGFLEGAANLINDSKDTTNAMCDACNQLAGESKTTCLKQLKCQ